MVVLAAATHLPHVEPLSAHAGAAARPMSVETGAAAVDAREGTPSSGRAVVREVQATARQAGLPCEVEAAVRPGFGPPLLALDGPLLAPTWLDSGAAGRCTPAVADPPPLAASQRRALLQVYLN